MVNKYRTFIIHAYSRYGFIRQFLFLSHEIYYRAILTIFKAKYKYSMKIFKYYVKQPEKDFSLFSKNLFEFSIFGKCNIMIGINGRFPNNIYGYAYFQSILFFKKKKKYIIKH